ncbi:hypothetical protein [Streptomyces sp. TE33382]
MSRSLVGRRAARWTAVTTAVLLALTGAELGASAAPATAAPAGAVSSDGLKPGDALTAHNFLLQMDGSSVEYLREVNGLDVENHRVTLVRGDFHSFAVERWIDDALAGRPGRLKDITVALLDSMDNPVKRYHFGGAFVERVEFPPSPGADALTVRFFTLTIE